MTRLPRRLLALLVLVRAAGFTSIVAVVWFRELHTTSEVALILTAAGVGSVVLPAAAGLLAPRRALRPLLIGTLALDGAALLVLPAAVGGSALLLAAVMLVVGGAAGLARSLIGTLITVQVEGDRQARTQSAISWTANVGGVVATGVAGLVTAAGIGYAPLMLVEGTLLLVAALLVPRPAPGAAGGPEPSTDAAGVRSASAVRRLGSPLLVALAGTALMQGLGIQFALTTATPGSYVYAALTNVVLLIGLQPLVLRVVRDERAPAYLVAGFAAGALTAVATAATDSWLAFGVGWTACELLVTAGMVPTILARVPAADHVAALGMVGSSWGLTAAITPAVSGAAVAAVGTAGSWGVLALVGALGAVGLPAAAALRASRESRESRVRGRGAPAGPAPG
ncbi:MFS transporter [Clavibacter tessellarius]|uniref:MFS transporter n=1 Tax=Clavibacter tessellarius TaxID=31965 RepID=UPI0039EA341B